MRLDCLPPLARPRCLSGVVGTAGDASARERPSRSPATAHSLSSPGGVDSAALIADGHHARSDATVSVGVILSAIAVALGAPIADPIIGVAITALILRITWQSWNTVRGHGHAH
jgi:Cation efflux family